jgi:hypothetical protein
MVPWLLVSCATQRPDLSKEDLTHHLNHAGKTNLALMHDIRGRLTRSLDADVAAGRRPSLDLLVLSGGGDWGAYGAGFLRAWAAIPKDDPHAMPDFDVVMGISTGALIAPYAYLGLYERIDEIYRHSSTDWARPHRLYGLITGNALYDISHLEETMHRELGEVLAPQLRASVQPNRSLVVATADLDLGILRLWDLQREAIAPARAYKVLRAAIAIPAAFEPKVIDGTLQADAGVLMQIPAVGHTLTLDKLMTTWNQAHPQTPVRLRYWVVVNNRTHETPTTVQPTWHGSLLRSSNMMVKAGIIAPLMSQYLRTQVLRQHGLEAEFHWTAVPTNFALDEDLNPFDPQTTRSLSDLGRRMAQSASPWRQDPPLFSQSEVEASAPTTEALTPTP